MSHVLPLLAALSWDPQIRGAVIVLTAIVILCGSVYLLLATNTGGKLGFLLAAAGLTGWMAVMGWVWVAYGIGLKGEEPHWKVLEVVTGPLTGQTTVEAAEGFPRDWRKLGAGDPVLGDAVATADRVLAPVAEPAGGHGEEGGGGETEVKIEPAFESTAEYVHVDAYATGGENYWIPGGGLAFESSGQPSGDRNPFEKAVDRLQRGPFHKPHYALLRVAPAAEGAQGAGAGASRPAPGAPITSVVMVRDQGNVRFPPFAFAVANTLLFAVVISALHRRDKAIMALRAPAPA